MKLIFLDIDGTLTPLGGTAPTESAILAMDQARARGHKVYLCTGRNRGMLAPLREMYPFDGAVGCAGGWIEAEGKVVYDHPMSNELLQKTMDVLHKANFCCVLECLDKAFMDEQFTALLQQPVEDGDTNSEWYRWRTSVSTSFGWRPISEYKGEPVYKVVFIGFDAEALRNVAKELDPWFQTCIHSTEDSVVINGEMIQREFDKGRGIRHVCEALQVPVEDTVAFGDGPNDIEMLQTAGLGICMGNGHPEVKKLVSVICPPVDEDGLLEGFRMAGLVE